MKHTDIQKQIRTNPIDEIPDVEIVGICSELGLDNPGENYFDRWVAAYHIIQPHLVDSDNYKDLLVRRAANNKLRDYAAEAREAKRSAAPPKLTFEAKCDIMLMEMENGDFSCLGRLTWKSAKVIQGIILGYYDNDEMELKKESDQYYEIYNKVGACGKRTVRAKRTTEKATSRRISKLNLLSDFDGYNSTPVERLFDEDYTSFIFYNTKYKKLVIVEVGRPENRWKGNTTLFGRVRRMTVKKKQLPDALKARSLKKMFEKVPTRKIYEDTRQRLNKDMIFLKAFKR